MSRPIRIEFPNALYHVTSRGDRREAIFEDDDDRLSFLQTLGQVVEQFNWRCYAWCLMDNHYHLLIQTPDGNLSKGMRQLNGVFTQLSNRRHRRVGHLFQGRFKAILVDSDAYLLELARYVVLNPVRSGMVKNAANWRWSSYRASMGLMPAEPFLAVDGLLAQFAARRSLAQARYTQFLQRFELVLLQRTRFALECHFLGACPGQNFLKPGHQSPRSRRDLDRRAGSRRTGGGGQRLARGHRDGGLPEPHPRRPDAVTAALP